VARSSSASPQIFSPCIPRQQRPKAEDRLAHGPSRVLNRHSSAVLLGSARGGGQAWGRLWWSRIALSQVRRGGREAEEQHHCQGWRIFASKD
jgi:hypothetical protein